MATRPSMKPSMWSAISWRVPLPDPGRAVVNSKPYISIRSFFRSANGFASYLPGQDVHVPLDLLDRERHVKSHSLRRIFSRAVATFSGSAPARTTKSPVTFRFREAGVAFRPGVAEAARHADQLHQPHSLVGLDRGILHREVIHRPAVLPPELGEVVGVVLFNSSSAGGSSLSRL